MKPMKLLLVEDDRDDIFFLKEALQSNGVAFNMHEIMTGDGVIPHLEENGHLPDVIILDLNLPRMHGKEVLKELKGTVKFKHIPVIVLTTSTSQEDMEYCARLGAEKFITKPVNLDDYDKIVDTITEQCGKKVN